MQPLNQSQETHTAKFGKNTSTNINREKVRSKLKNMKEQKKRLSDLKTKKEGRSQIQFKGPGVVKEWTGEKETAGLHARIKVILGKIS